MSDPDKDRPDEEDIEKWFTKPKPGDVGYPAGTNPNQWVVKPYEVWQHVRDIPALNSIFEKHLSDKEYAGSILHALSRFNEKMPLTGFTAVNFPFPSLLLEGAVLHSIETLLTWHAMNRVHVSNGGITEDIHAVYQDLLGIFQIKKQEWDSEVKEQKKYINMNSLWGTTGVGNLEYEIWP